MKPYARRSGVEPAATWVEGLDAGVEAVDYVRAFLSSMGGGALEGCSVLPLLSAPRMLRHAAVDLFPELIQVLSHQVGDLVAQMERRCATAKSLLEQLEGLEAQIAASREALRDEAT